MNKQDFIGVEKGIDASSFGMEEIKAPELQELINRFAIAIGHLGFDIVSIEEALNKIDPNLLEQSDINKTPEQEGFLGTLRHLSYLLENEVGKVEAIKKALKKLA